MKALSEHAMEMLGLIASRTSVGMYWAPKNKNDGFTTAAGKFVGVFVSGPWSTGAIRTLTSRGLVKEIPSQQAHRWARRVTPAGLQVLADAKMTPRQAQDL